MNTAPLPWPRERSQRAGLSSLGVGGTTRTSCEEAPTRTRDRDSPGQLFMLAALRGGARAATARLTPARLGAHHETDLADAVTLRAGRRCSLTGVPSWRNRADAIGRL